MGKLVSSTIPNLISGVSQQPWNVRLPTQAEEQVNCQSSVTDFLKRRPATRHLARIRDTPAANGIASHHINRDETEQYIVTADASGINVFDLEGNAKTVSVTGTGAAGYLAAAATTPNRDLRFLTINDYTFVLNRRVTVKTLPDLSPKRPPEAIVFIKQASYNTTYSINLNGTAYSTTTEDGVAPADQPADKLSSLDICNALAQQLPKETFSVQTSNSTIWIRRHDGGDFTVKVQDSRSNTHMSVCKGKVQRFSDLPTVAPRGFVTEIIGDASSSFDNYFCVFEPSDAGDAFGSGTWKETVKPGIPCKLDPATLPHALIRQADGTFTFGPLKWGERSCGDETSAPFPSFVGRTLNGLFFYRNRLSFLSGENVVMSEVGEFFNFFLTTVTTLVDSDVVDVAASHTKSSILHHAVTFSGGLLLFSDQSQFVLEHDTVLSNATVSVKPVTEFEASMRAAPVSSGKTVFFATDKGEWGGVREYITLPDNSDQNDASDITAHVPRYVRGGISRLECSTNEDMLLVLSDQKRTSLWLYKYFWNGSEKIQSAWSRWDMCGEVLSAAILNTGIYLIMQYGDGVYLEKMDITPGYKDEGETFEYCLDRKLTEQDVTLGAYDAINKTTAITLPYDIPAGYTPVVVTRTGGQDAPGNLLRRVRVTGPRTLTVEGPDAHGKKLFIGIPYTSSYTFSTFAIREGDNKGNAVTTGRLQLRRLTLNCSNTGFLHMHVTPKCRPTSTHTFTGRELGHGTNIIGAIPLYTGTISFPILSLNTQAEVKAESDSFLPFALVNASWEGFYNTRNARV
ncbi:phage nozzle protein [Bilophila wadsworthia]